jgi:hypothetical protein
LINLDKFAAALQLRYLLFIFDQETLKQERCVGPRPIEFGDEHADPDVLGGYLG